jgi:hypothetical protein
LNLRLSEVLELSKQAPSKKFNRRNNPDSCFSSRNILKLDKKYWSQHMYLCDQMRAISEILSDDDPILKSSPFTQWMKCKMDDVLEDAQLFILERTALMAAGNLRLGDPERLERMLNVVLGEPGRYFIECSHKQRDEAMGAMLAGGSLRLTGGRYAPQRIALDVNIVEPGRAFLKPYWCFPQHMAEPIPADVEGGRLRREAIKRLSLMGISYGTMVIDINQGSFESFEDFAARVRQEGLPSDLQRSAEYILENKRHTERQVLEMAWQQYRLNSYTAFEVDNTAENAILDQVMNTGQTVDEVVESARSDLNGELIFAIAQMATLLARLDTDAFRVEDRPARAQKSVKRPRLQDMPLPKVSVVSLEKSRGSGKSAQGSTGIKSGKRIRHAVSGHLFLARNKKMVWRRGHFRGSLEGPQATRIG